VAAINDSVGFHGESYEVHFQVNEPVAYHGFLVEADTSTEIVVAGNVTPAGSLVVSTSTGQSETGSITPTGTLVANFILNETEAGSVTPTGALVVSLAMPETVAGSITPAGTLTISTAVATPVAGSITPAGALVVQYVDTEGPEQITGLTATPFVYDATLYWTAPHDNAGPPPVGGPATSYDLRYSMCAAGLFVWGTATSAAGLPTPGTPNSTDSYSLVGLSANTTYSWAIIAYDEVGNPSVQSAVHEFKTNNKPAGAGDNQVPRGVSEIRGQPGRAIR